MMMMMMMMMTMMMMMIVIVIVMMMMMMNGWLLSLPAVFRKLWSMLVKVNKYAIIFSFPFSNAIMTILFPIGIITVSYTHLTLPTIYSV